MKKTKITKATSQERNELLERLWIAHVRKLVDKIEKTPSTEIDAATFNSCAKLLADNGITADVLNKDNAQAGSTLAAQARALQLDENGDYSDLNTPVPVPVLTEENHAALKRLDHT